MEKVNHPVFRSQHNGGARGKGQAIQSDVRRNHGWRRVLFEVTPPQPFQRRPLGLRPSHGQSSPYRIREGLLTTIPNIVPDLN